MSRLIRFLSRRRTGRGIQKVGDGKPRKGCINCKIILLDGTDISIDIDKKALGQELLERVYYNLDLIEKDYFGLQYSDAAGINHWLDPTKSIKKQVQIGPPYTLRLRVKFYSSEPNNLHEELTRYQFFLQLKLDLLNGRLECPYETVIELAAYALQCKYIIVKGRIHNSRLTDPGIKYDESLPNNPTIDTE
ncbi:band 4.1-like protein 5 [Lingula anatina]|uniref:Band 4.1-like protein 5 n=1 Tax=Lingula anatina TaxID=7574 RepID=A0A1S3JHP1_LINAN|nr:band 4.1-like protein 5 [Lingula anatina]|eukprot:XP_013409661.1 band 4.1-like protein 5 [Lingula anatina]